MKVEAIEDSEGLGTHNALISAAIDMFSTTVLGTTTEVGHSTYMWPTIKPYPMGDDLVAAASWAAEDMVVACYAIVFIMSSP